jgi:hypothetical protein
MRKTFNLPTSSASGIRRYAYGFGFYKYNFTINIGPGGFIRRDLLGCVINGTVYGDTSLPIGINIISSEIPEEFKLFQNYPNPFNPETEIKLDLPKSSNINLVICDMLGRELYQISNEYLKAGSYTFTWDAREFSSGIYFYRLVADDYVETKKMILIK